MLLGRDQHDIFLDLIVTEHTDFSHLSDKARHGLRQPLQESITDCITRVCTYGRWNMECLSGERMTDRNTPRMPHSRVSTNPLATVGKSTTPTLHKSIVTCRGHVELCAVEPKLSFARAHSFHDHKQKKLHHNIRQTYFTEILKIFKRLRRKKNQKNTKWRRFETHVKPFSDIFLWASIISYDDWTAKYRR